MSRFWSWLMYTLVLAPARRYEQRLRDARFEAWRRDGGVEAGLPSGRMRLESMPIRRVITNEQDSWPAVSTSPASPRPLRTGRESPSGPDRNPRPGPAPSPETPATAGPRSRG